MESGAKTEDDRRGGGHEDRMEKVTGGQWFRQTLMQGIYTGSMLAGDSCLLPQLIGTFVAERWTSAEEVFHWYATNEDGCPEGNSGHET